MRLIEHNNIKIFDLNKLYMEYIRRNLILIQKKKIARIGKIFFDVGIYLL